MLLKLIEFKREVAIKTVCQEFSDSCIDRLVEIYQADQLIAADIVDFKTDRIDSQAPDALKTKVEHYRPQIEAYRKAVAQMAGLDESAVSARLLFVGSGDTEAVE